jgi:hypothetical protein
VSFDSLAEKAFSARSIKLCLVDNQRSSGVAVGSNLADLKPDRQRRVLHQSNVPLPLGRSGLVLISRRCGSRIGRGGSGGGAVEREGGAAREGGEK